MSGWGSDQEIWEQARALGKTRNADERVLLVAGADYLAENSVTDEPPINGTLTLMRLGILEDYIEAVQAREEAASLAS